ncbi:flagellar protein FlaG [Pseudoalteromonas sp. P1-9]|uniref:flagellar protein FlaG n=1 Tax=Pseudoalteromonas sp. P1-9 TaxID=1710354 RepID=UPI0006D6195B|nr:flagellar protein FlaG [Pseudoalteromonas sp. P1-9]KPV97334.1 flagellar protein FlaG [Pseudoalteromonas sp. P1-9]
MNTIQEPLTSVFDTNNAPVAQETKPVVGTDRAKDEKNLTQTLLRPDESTAALKDKSFFEEIKDNLKKINDFIPVSSTNLIFEFDELGEPPVVKVIDKSNDEVIREIPPKEIREVAKAFENLADKLNTQTGILFNDSV